VAAGTVDEAVARVTVSARATDRISRGDLARALAVTHVVAGLARESGGPSYSVPALAAALSRRGVDVRLRSVGGAATAPEPVDGVAQATHPAAITPLGKLLRSSPALKTALAADAHDHALLHAHGLWLMPNVYPGRLKSASGDKVTIVHSPRGMLAAEALRISAWKKRPFWWLLQRSALEAADCLHATAASEYEEVRAAGLKNPVAIIPNGIDLPPKRERRASRRDGNTVLSFGRIHPKKGLDRLVRAWAGIESEFPGWKLRIVGPAELGHDRELRALVDALAAQRVTIEGPIYDAAGKLEVYRDASLFVLPTLNENFALTVAEALAGEVPVVATKGAPWSGLERERCGWWIDHGVEALASALRRAMSASDEERQLMGQRGRDWMRREFSWDRIARDMHDVYRWLRTGGAPPATVRIE